MDHTPKHTSNVITFPLYRARPPLIQSVRTMRDEALTDAQRGLWDSLPEGNNDRICCSDLCDMLPPLDNNTTTNNLALAIAASDFALLGLFAIQTGQWMRPDLLEPLMAIQSAAQHTLALHTPHETDRIA